MKNEKNLIKEINLLKVENDRLRNHIEAKEVISRRYNDFHGRLTGKTILVDSGLYDLLYEECLKYIKTKDKLDAIKNKVNKKLSLKERLTGFIEVSY